MEVVHSTSFLHVPVDVATDRLVCVSVVSNIASAAVVVIVSEPVVSDFPVDVVENSSKDVLVTRLELVRVSVCVMGAVDVFVALCNCTLVVVVVPHQTPPHEPHLFSRAHQCPAPSNLVASG